MPTRITLIRHGQTAWNVVGRIQGHACVPLNDHGHEQARLLAEHLAPDAATFSVIYSSDLLRARQTAAHIADRLGKPVLLDPRLREIDLGEWQGLTSAEVQQWDGKRAEVISADPENTPRPGGESWRQVADRAIESLHFMATEYPDGNILAVSHGGVIAHVLIHLHLALPPLISVENTSLTLVTYDHAATSWQLEYFNQRDHLSKTPPRPDTTADLER